MSIKVRPRWVVQYAVSIDMPAKYIVSSNMTAKWTPIYFISTKATRK